MARNNKSDDQENTPYETEQDVRDAHYYEDGVNEAGDPVETDEKVEDTNA